MSSAATAHGGKTSSARVRRNQAHGGGHEEEGGSERWLVTYADMLTLLLVLFIVLFSISVVNTSKFISLKTSLAAVFGDGKVGVMGGGTGLSALDNDGTSASLVTPGLPNTLGTAAQQAAAASRSQLNELHRTAASEAQNANFQRIESSLRRALTKAGVASAVRFGINSRGLVITVVTSDLVFGPANATLRPGGQNILRVIAPALATETRHIEVDGYTNQLKGGTGIYPSGWALSSARASSVVVYLAAHGVAQSRLTAVGYSDQHPLYPASDPRSVTLNRRVEIVVLSNVGSS